MAVKRQKDDTVPRKSVQIRLTIPAADTQVLEWFDLQDSMRDSVRQLVRDSIAREGMVDVFNKPVVPGARSRAKTPVVEPEFEAPATVGEVEEPASPAPKSPPARKEKAAKPVLSKAIADDEPEGPMDDLFGSMRDN